MSACNICGALFSSPCEDSSLAEHEIHQHALQLWSEQGPLVFGIGCEEENGLATARQLRRARQELERYFPGKRFDIQAYTTRESRYALSYSIPVRFIAYEW